MQAWSLTPGAEILVGTFAYRLSASHFISEHRAQQNLPERKGVRTLSMKAGRGTSAPPCWGPLKAAARGLWSLHLAGVTAASGCDKPHKPQRLLVSAYVPTGAEFSGI